MIKYIYLALFLQLFLVKNLKSQTITNYYISDGLLDNFVECVAVDDNDNIWFGTISGVSMYEQSSGNWISYTVANYPGMASNIIKEITVTANGEVWIGTDFGASKYDGNSWITYNSTNGLNNNQVKCISEDQNGGIWIGTNQGVSYYDGINWTSFGFPDLHWSGVSGVAFDSQGDKWFGAPLGGLMHYDGTTFAPYDTSNGLLSQNVTDILIDAQDKKWIGTGSGISVLNSSNTLFTHHTKMYILSPPDTLNPVVEIEQDGLGNIWTAIYVGYLAEGGVAYWNGSQWTDYDHTDGIAGQNIKGLAIDSQNNVWIATSTGVSKISVISNLISDSFYDQPRNLIRKIDVLGREINEEKNKIIFYIYNNGEVIKKMNIH